MFFKRALNRCTGVCFYLSILESMLWVANEGPIMSNIVSLLPLRWGAMGHLVCKKDKKNV